MADNKWTRIAILVVGLALYAFCGYGWVHGPSRTNIDLIGLAGGGLFDIRVPTSPLI